MDCKTARMLLEFTRPSAPELEADDAEALEAHLGVCADCDALARAERRLDAHLGAAMRRVEVPAGLRSRLLDRLAADRNALHRRWAGHGVRALAAAAALLLAAAGVAQWRHAHRPEPDAASIWEGANERQAAPWDKKELEAAFRRDLGVETVLPDLDYRLLCSYGLGPFEGEKVPQLVFVRKEGPHALTANVYVLSERQFNLDRQPPAAVQADPGYTYKVELDVRDGRRYADVIVYDGDAVGWLRGKGADAEGN